MDKFAFEFPNGLLRHRIIIRVLHESKSILVRYLERRSSLTSEANPGAVSVHVTAGGAIVYEGGLIPKHSVISASRRVSRRSLSTLRVTVYGEWKCNFPECHIVSRYALNDGIFRLSEEHDNLTVFVVACWCVATCKIGLNVG